MIALLGPPPRTLLEKSKAMAKHNWPYPVSNDTGELCNSAEEFFHGPFFNAKGELTAAISMSIPNILTFFFFWDEFRYSEFIPSLKLGDTTTILEEKDREAFLSFARQMLSWQPEKRKTARELMDHPFLKLGGWPTAHLLWKNKIPPKRRPALILAICQLSLNHYQYRARYGWCLSRDESASVTRSLRVTSVSYAT